GAAVSARNVRAEENASPIRPPEGSVIINLPSADPIGEGSLQLLINHRFSDPVQDSTFHSFFSFFSGATVGLGLSYAPVRGLEAGFLRGQALEDWEVFAKYGLLSSPTSPLHAAVRIGGNIKGQKNFEDRTSFFAQGIVAFTIAERVRVSAVPTFSTRAAGLQDIPGVPLRSNVFNVPLALSASLTRSINVQGEFVPHTNINPGAGWIVAIEKTVPRHRFSFTVGNLRDTTVDQYVASDFRGLSPHNIYFGFNIIRQWKLK
ncbi:MAG: DUF5777 family beta-barrel protein, partial [Thermoanaerobaculia bacterium]